MENKTGAPGDPGAACAVDTLKLPPRRRGSTTLGLALREGSRIRRVMLPVSGCAVIGRDADADIVIDVASVSRRHARVLGGELPGLEDLGSTNGTWVNGRPLERGTVVMLEEGASLKLGDALAVVEQIDEPSRGVAEEGPDEVAVASARMREAHDRVRLFARGHTPILILGETGVGKEVYSSIIVAMSPRASKPFLRLNCAALPKDMVESELFGFERGAFTGAAATKIGLLESAHGGTVLLDEIGETSLGTQAKLLRALESGEILRLGAVRARTVDVRILAATNRDLAAMVREGSFRADLFYRLAGAEVVLPPLRERLEDMEPLTAAFLRRACAAQGVATKVLTEAAKRRLLAHSWPGNVRELKSTIERAVLISPGEDAVDDVHISFVGHARWTGAPPAVRPVADTGVIALTTRKKRAASPAEGEEDTQDFYEVQREREKGAMLEALLRCSGNQTQAALQLGMPRRTFVKRLTEYGIRAPRRSEPADGDD